MQVLQGQIHLEHLQDLEATKKIIEDLKEVLEESGNVTPVHGKYFLLASNYYRRVGQHSDYYRCGLQFLGCSLDEYPKEEWPQQAFFLGLAALLGDGIYNIGELVTINFPSFSMVEMQLTVDFGYSWRIRYWNH